MQKEVPILPKRTRTIIAAIILLCFFIVFGGITVSYVSRFDEELTAQNQTRLTEVADYISSNMTSVVLNTQDSLKAVASAVAAIEPGEERRDYLERVAKQYEFAYIGCAAEDGMLYATVPSESVDISKESYFIEGMKGESTVSNLTRKIFKDRAASGVLMAVPMGKDEPKGVLVAMMEVSKLSSILEVESFGGEGYSYIFDKEGSIIMRTKSLDFNNLFNVWQTVDFEKGYSYEAFYDDVQNDQPGLTCFTKLGVKQYANYQPIPFNDWTIVNVVSEKVVSAKTNQLIRELMLIGGGTVVGFMALMYVALRAYSVSQQSRLATNAKSAFLANMSHEIRTPMNAVVGLSEILLRDNLTSSQRNKVLNILNSGKGLLTIINDILDISKIESGKFTIVDERYEFESMLYDLTVIAAIRIGEKPVEFLIEIDPELPRVFIGDMGRVKQVLLNIVGNAIKFTNQGSIRLILNGKQEGSTYQLHMEIRDTGIGIRDEDLKELFVSFNQVDTGRNRNIEGTGLGLTISQKLCEMMGGSISVTSEYGKGSSFVVVIHQGIAEDAPPRCTVDPDTALLVCEPSEILRAYESACLDRLGLRYDICASKKEFGELACSGSYTHVLASKEALRHLYDCKPVRNMEAIMLFGLNEHSLIDSGTANVYVPLFQIQLPYALTGVADISRGAVKAGVSMEAIKPMPYVSILIVDDNMVNIEVGKGLMEPYCMHMDHACSGEESIRMVRSKKYDLVLMDHMMPGMSGIEAVKRIRELPEEHYQTMPIVALTANAATDAYKMFLQEGFDDFLAKPIETQKLDAILRKYLKSINAERAAEHAIEPMASEKIEMTAPVEYEGQMVELDFQKGISGIGSSPAYGKILQIYLDSSREKVKLLPLWMETDQQRFVIEIHGLKSASAAVGADGLSILAEEMEKMGKAGDYSRMEEALLHFLARMNVAFSEAQDFLDHMKDSVLPSALPEESSECKKHVAVVDDNPVNLKLAEAVLAKDYHLTMLESGEELLRFLGQCEPDLILLDIQMPGMNGYETLRIIKGNEEWRHIPVIFLTGQNDIPSEREGFRLGAKDFITKPFDNVVMLARIQSQLELYQYQKELKTVIGDKTQEVEELQHVITVSWAEIIESRDGTTGSHVRHTTYYYEGLLKLLCESPTYQDAFAREDVFDLLRASSLHDIGKIGISDLVLKKPGALTADEFRDMKRHAEIGAHMIKKIIENSRPDRFLIYARDMALYHHERWDGTGYPCGLKQDEIPVYVQALTIADVFDALTAVRPYKRAFTFDEAMEIMCKDRGSFYSPKMFDIFWENRGVMQRMLEDAIKDLDDHADEIENVRKIEE